MTRAKQRSKTGCFMCRRRRKKCGEERPICHNCSTNEFNCVWPSQGDVLDRQNRLFKRDLPMNTCDASESFRDAYFQSSAACDTMNIHPSLSPSPSAMHILGIECELFHHFQHYFLPGLLSFTWDKKSLMEYQHHVMQLALNFSSVKYAILSSCAANKYILCSESRYEKVALSFYARAVKEVTSALSDMSSRNLVPTDELLVSVIYLYIHDLWGKDPEVNPTAHVAGAMILINMRLDQDSSSMSMTRAIDRVAVESVIYQAFLLSSRKPLTPTFSINETFISRTESPLGTVMSPGSSPIISLPLPLYRVIWNIIELCTAPMDQKKSSIDRMAHELEWWGCFVFERAFAEPGPTFDDYCHASFQGLYVIAVSILFDWTSCRLVLPLTIKFSNINTPLDQRSSLTNTSPWPVKRALAILNQRDVLDVWCRSFLAAWPMLIFGLATHCQEEANFIRHVLVRMRNQMGYGLAQRTLEELELEWRAKWYVF